MLAAELAEEAEGEAVPATTEEGVESEESRDVEKLLQEKEELEKENDMIKKFGFTFDDEGQIVLPEVQYNVTLNRIYPGHWVYFSIILGNRGSHSCKRTSRTCNSRSFEPRSRNQS